MSIRTETFLHVTDEVEDLLKAHIPYSLPLLRRLQTSKYRQAGASTSTESRTILVTGAHDDGRPQHQRFTAAYLDLSGGPETQMWLYSTLENAKLPPSHDDEAYYRKQLSELVRAVTSLVREYGSEAMHYPGGLLLGTLSTPVRRLLEDMDRVRPRATGYYDKWLFRAEDLPPEGELAELPRGMRPLLASLPSEVIRLDNGTPVAWAFLGPDGSLISLHCEEPYRRRGLSKALAAKLMRRGPGAYADDGWASADVAGDNLASRAMCKSLGGTRHWEVSWVLFDVTDDGVGDSG
ncbi:hypothetical protein ACRE_065290 [Hapsidospora chrysogenum ATCC 11550]|uniref:N-acetyltransferase domain-containing protein n=1 Tax=Hapsidospora chrysogenum (strain ATCC 11550 / CBS 779.69 / DSM 880 / IAM 14645 / JCM 23072 / IMI 49137) TaxID=857340 RepID=A0A086T062_HAPC1|nr:hypothetical protein ACRE_065290 [Hapsidospora chrysogenum ATCC 11550]